MDNSFRKYVAEFFGTMVLVIMGCGVAVVTGGDVVPTALAFGLSIVAMAYAIGNISGCHLNPAVTIAQLINRKINLNDAIMYITFQIVGAIFGAAILYGVFVGCDWYSIASNGIGCNGYGAGIIGMGSAFVLEFILTMIFVLVILGVCADKKMTGREGIIIGATLTFVHLLGIYLTGTSVNPARSIGPALIACVNDTTALGQVWLFILAPIFGAIVAAVLFKFVFDPKYMFVEKVVDACEEACECAKDSE